MKKEMQGQPRVNPSLGLIAVVVEPSGRRRLLRLLLLLLLRVGDAPQAWSRLERVVLKHIKEIILNL